MGERYVAFDGFVLDAVRREVTRAGLPVALTPKALEILAVLLDHAGDLVTKEQLLESLWPGEFVQESNLAQHVYLLRKALTAQGGSDSIKTVPRRGYRFAGEVRRSALPPDARAGASPGARGAGARTAVRALWPRAVAVAVALCVLVAALAVGLGKLGERGTPQPARAELDHRAERAYHLGRYYWNKRNAADLERALGQFALVVHLAPASPLGYSGLADSQFQLAMLTENRIGPHMRAAHRYAREALRNGSTSAEAYTTWGFDRAYFAWDDRAAAAAYEHAIALDPTYGTAHHWYALLVLNEGNFPKAIAELRTAASLDPTSVPIARWLGFAYYYAHRYDEALAQLHQALELDPENGLARLHYALALEMRGRPLEALAAIALLPHDQFDPTELDAYYAYAHALAGQSTLAEREIRAVAASPKARKMSAVTIAATLLVLGRKREAVAYLRDVHELQFNEESDSIYPTYDPRIAAILPLAKLHVR